MALALEELDVLIDDLRQASLKEDWESLAVLDGRVRPIVEAVMAAMAKGDVTQSLVQERLETLQEVCLQSRTGAEKARAEARKALEGMSRTTKAARAYQDVSGGRSG